MPRKHAFGPTEERRMVARYEAGKTCQSLAIEAGVHFRVIQRVLTEHGVYEAGRKFQGRYSEENKAAMVADYLDGAPLAELGRKYGCTALNVRHILQRRGVPLRDGRARPLSAKNEEHIRKRRAEGAPFSVIAKELDVPAHRAVIWGRQLGLSDFLVKRGPESHAWRGGKITHYGYIYVRLSSDDWCYPMAGQNQYAPEHRVVMARHLGRLLAKSETVHHVNGDKADNRIENLQLRQGRHGKGARFVCKDCGSHNVEAATI